MIIIIKYIYIYILFKNNLFLFFFSRGTPLLGPPSPPLDFRHPDRPPPGPPPGPPLPWTPSIILPGRPLPPDVPPPGPTQNDPREAQTHRDPWPQFHEKTPREKKRVKMEREMEKKREMLDSPPFGPPPSGAPLSQKKEKIES